MTIDADLILREAREFQQLELSPARAAELAVEVHALIQPVAHAANSAEFDDEPARFLHMLSALRDAPLG
jgi:hypothetical protein